MSQTQPSSTNDDTQEKAADDLDGLSGLEEGDTILTDDRERQIVVRETVTRDPDLVDGHVTQHGIRASGDWSEAVSVELWEEIHIRGQRTGAIVDKKGRERDVRRADR